MELTDERALRALAHPLRMDLVELLSTVGPATAAVCARRIGSTQASCSYHLRQLARYGLVERDAPADDGRERPWRLVDVEQRWRSGSAAALAFERVFVRREADRVLGWHERVARQPPTWRDAAFLTGVSLPLTTEETVELRARLEAVVQPYVARMTDPTLRPERHRYVRVLLAGTPDEENPDERDDP